MSKERELYQNVIEQAGKVLAAREGHEEQPFPFLSGPNYLDDKKYPGNALAAWLGHGVDRPSRHGPGFDHDDSLATRLDIGRDRALTLLESNHGLIDQHSKPFRFDHGEGKARKVLGAISAPFLQIVKAQDLIEAARGEARALVKDIEDHTAQLHAQLEQFREGNKSDKDRVRAEISRHMIAEGWFSANVIHLTPAEILQSKSDVDFEKAADGWVRQLHKEVKPKLERLVDCNPVLDGMPVKQRTLSVPVNALNIAQPLLKSLRDGIKDAYPSERAPKPAIGFDPKTVQHSKRTPMLKEAALITGYLAAASEHLANARELSEPSKAVAAR